MSNRDIEATSGVLRFYVAEGEVPDDGTINLLKHAHRPRLEPPAEGDWQLPAEDHAGEDLE